MTHDQVEAMTMGHRVAVLHDGVLQQCDTPHELYHAPGNLFVAGFIGSPAMNLVTLARSAGSGVGARGALLDAAGRAALANGAGESPSASAPNRCGSATSRSAAEIRASRTSAPRSSSTSRLTTGARR